MNALTQLLATKDFQDLKESIIEEINGGKGLMSRAIEKPSSYLTPGALDTEDSKNLDDIVTLLRSYAAALEAQVLSLCSLCVIQTAINDDDGEIQNIMDDSEMMAALCEDIKTMCFNSMGMVNLMVQKSVKSQGIDLP